MKTLKYVALMLAVMMLAVAVTGCGSANEEKVTINVTVSAVTEEGAVFGPVTVAVPVTDDDPATVLRSSTLAMDDAGVYYELSDDQLSLESINDYLETSDAEYTYFWEYTLNGVAPDAGRAGTVEVKDGDVIVFNYVKILTSELAEAGE